MRIALYQPEIAGNVGAVLRLAACFGVPVDLVEPLGFALSDARLRRAAMDYGEAAEVRRHADWAAYCNAAAGRSVLLTTHGDIQLFDFEFKCDDTLLFGSESAGVPPAVAQRCAARLRIPIRSGLRSLNLAVAAGIALSEALRQTGGLPQ